jgi:hypothetical protein
MGHDGSGVSALVGLGGFVVTAQLLDETSGEWWLAVETVDDRAWCEICGLRAIGHGRRRVVLRDLPMADRPVVLVWAKRLWRCGEAACSGRTWSEESGKIAPRAVLTERPGPRSVGWSGRVSTRRRSGPELRGVLAAGGHGRRARSRPAPRRPPRPPGGPERAGAR